MLYMPVHLLQEGMVLSSNVPSPYEKEPLLYKDTILTKAQIDDLDAVGIAGVYIKSSYTQDVVLDDCMGMIERVQSLSFVRHVMSHPAQNDDFESELDNILEKILHKISDNSTLRSNMYYLRCYDNYTYEHSLRVTINSILVAIKLGFNDTQLWEIGVAALLHDIGKTAIDTAVLNKREQLTAAEWRSIRKHPEVGCAQVEHYYKYSKDIGDGILYHHERYDGSGYPYGLKGKNIPLYARIIGCADIYDALTSRRAYRDAWFPCQALDWMETEGSKFVDPDIYAAFKEVIIPYPEGSVVVLSNGELAVVIKMSTNKSRPIVRTINAEESVVIDLSASDLSIKGTGYNDSRLLPKVTEEGK